MDEAERDEAERDEAARVALAAALCGEDAERDAALAQLRAADPERRRRLVDAAVAGALVATLDQASRTRQRRAADVLVELLGDAPALGEALRSALGGPAARARWGAAYVLGRAGPPPREVWTAAVEALALDDGDQRWAAAELACRAVRAHPELRARLVAELVAPGATLRKMALYCLRDLGDADLGELARERLDDPDPGVRLAALAALARAAPTEAAALAVARVLAEDPDAGVRRSAAATLGRLGAAPPAVRGALEAAAGSSDASLARAARAALTALDRAPA